MLIIPSLALVQWCAYSNWWSQTVGSDYLYNCSVPILFLGAALLVLFYCKLLYWFANGEVFIGQVVRLTRISRWFVTVCLIGLPGLAIWKATMIDCRRIYLLANREIPIFRTRWVGCCGFLIDASVSCNDVLKLILNCVQTVWYVYLYSFEWLPMFFNREICMVCRDQVGGMFWISRSVIFECQWREMV